MKKEHQQRTSDSKWSKPFIYLIILAVVNICIFSRTSTYEFVNIDDGVLIHENPLITDSSIPYSEVFKSKLYGPHYKPLTFLTWKWQYHVIGKTASAFHTINWILHLINSIFLFFIGRLLFTRLYDDKKWVHISAFLLALFFAINPLRLESVAWATERKDVLFSFFFLLSWWIYIKYINQKKYYYIIIGALLYLLSGLSKSMGITLIAVLFLTDLWYNRKIIGKLIAEKIPYFISFLGLIYLYGFFGGKSSTSGEFSVEKSTEGVITSYELINDLPYAIQLGLSASLRFILWIIHSILPFNISAEYNPDYMFETVGIATFLFPIIVIALLVFAWKKRKTWRPFIGGLLFYSLTISPVLTYSQSGQAAFLADRYTYIPCIGIFFALIYFINKLKENKSKHLMLAGGFSLLFFVVSALNVGNWQNSETLFNNVLRFNSTSSLAYLNLGMHHRSNNNTSRAIQIYSQGIAQAPSPELYSNRGKIYFDQGNYEQAMADFNIAVKMQPNYPDALANRAGIFGLQQNWEACFKDLDKALKLDDDNINALHNRGVAHYQQGNYQKAINDFSKYIKQEPLNANIINTIGLCLAQLGNYKDAIAYYNRSIQLNSTSGAYFYNRSLAYKVQGNKAKAFQDAQKAKKLGFNITSEYLNSIR